MLDSCWVSGYARGTWNRRWPGGRPLPCHTPVDASQPFVRGQSWLRAGCHWVDVFLVGVRLQWGRERSRHPGAAEQAPAVQPEPSSLTSCHAACFSASMTLSDLLPTLGSKPSCPHLTMAFTLHPRWSPNTQVHSTSSVWAPQDRPLGAQPAPLTLLGTIMEIGSIRPFRVTSL